MSLRSIRQPAITVLLLAAAWGCRDVAAPGPPPDVTAEVERLGNPFTVPTPYARNVWDMQRFGGRIWLGHGNSSDNTGPTPIWSLDPATGRFASDFTADEEQVDIFRVLGGELYVPGHDSREDWSFGSFYRLEGGRWVKHRAIPHGLHVFDLALHRGRLFAAIDSENKPGQHTLLASDDRGAAWKPAADELTRFLTLFEFSGDLYAAPPFWNHPDSAHRVLLRYDGSRFVRTAVAGPSLVSALSPSRGGRMVRPVEFAGALVYVLAGRDFDWAPVALGIVRSWSDIRTVALPDPATLPYDFLIRGTTLYLLAAAPAEGGYTIYVYATSDLEEWRELFRFRAATFARSFEEEGGDFYFGLGSSRLAPSPATGDVLRVRLASYAGG